MKIELKTNPIKVVDALDLNDGQVVQLTPFLEIGSAVGAEQILTQMESYCLGIISKYQSNKYILRFSESGKFTEGMMLLEKKFACIPLQIKKIELSIDGGQ